MSSTIKVSIIICTHRRFDLLQLAVNSFCHQNSPKDFFEIIVIDNDILSNNEVIKITESANKRINIRYIHEPILGLSQARNTGGKAAFGKYVGYMDDDAKAKENYIDVLIKLIQTNQYDIIGGPYYAFYLTPKPKWFNDKYESIDSGNSHFFNKNEFLNGTNMVFKKTILDEVQWFNSSFGMAGKRISYGEETDLQLRIWGKNENLKVFYSSELVVYHLVPPKKMKIPDKFRRSFIIGKSQAYMWNHNDYHKTFQRNGPFRLLKALIHMIILLPNCFLLRNRVLYPFWQNYAYEVISRTFISIGQELRYTQDLFRIN